MKLPYHAHLQVLGRGDVAVPEVSARVGRQVVIGEAGADVDGDGRVGHTIIERGSVGITVEVDGVLLEQVRAHDHAHVGQGKEKFVVLVEGYQRRGDVAVHHTDVDDLAWIDVAVQHSGGRS